MCFSHRRANLCCFLERPQRAFNVFDFTQSATKIIPGPRIARVETKRLSKMLNSLLRFAVVHQRTAQVMMGFGKLRSKFDGLFPCQLRILDTAQAVEHDAEVLIGFGIIWPSLDRA